jgi:hypothetical protein
MRIVSNCEARLDAFAPRYETNVLPPGRYDDRDIRIAYVGAWVPGRRFEHAFEGTDSYTHDAGAEIRFDITGSAFVVGFARAPNRGRAKIWIDGVLVSTLDQYGPDIQWQAQERYTVASAGRHSVAIQFTGEKDPRSQAAFVDLDYIVVEP